VSAADRRSEADRVKARNLAERAYHAAVREDWAAANLAMAEAGRQTPNVIALVLSMFCDTIIGLQRARMGLPPGEDGVPEDGPVRPGWFNADTGQMTMDADDAGLPAAVRWAGQLVAARAALDFDGFQALLQAMPADGFKRGEYANALLRGCALAGATP
jgi:hypothetical protein